MTTQPLYFGGEMDAFLPSDNGVVEAAGAGHYNATYCRCAITVPTGSNLKSIQFASQTGAVYYHFDLYYTAFTTNVDNTVFRVQDNSGVDVFTIVIRPFSTFLTWKIYYLSAPGVLTQLGSSVNTALNTLQTVDLLVDKANGLGKLWLADTLQISGSASFSSITNMAQTVHQTNNGSATAYFSQMFASTSPTVGQKLQTLVEDTVGAATDWTGPIGNVNEMVYNDALGITATTNGNTNTYKIASASIVGTVLGVGTSARFNVQATGPQHLQNVLRVSGTNYNSGNTTGATGFAPAQNMWMTNPATSGAWTAVAAGATEWGVEAIT